MILTKHSFNFETALLVSFQLPEIGTSQAAQSRCTVVRPIQKSIGKWEIRPPVKS